MNLTLPILATLAAWVAWAIPEATLVYLQHARIRHAHINGRPICQTCRGDLDNYRDAAHAGIWYQLDYLASIAAWWPIYRGRQLLELLHLVAYRPRHDGPCDLDRTTPATSVRGCQAHQRRPE